jgi:hypothetical protein
MRAAPNRHPMHRRLAVFCLTLAGLGLTLGFAPGGVGVASRRLQATVAATVTGTPSGPMILVPEQVNVRTGPAINYPQVGILIAGQTAPALGRSPGGDWLQIVYPGVPGNVAWVYAAFVVLQSFQPGGLPVVEPPPTPTPRVTATIDATLAAQFNLGEPTATRLPTFTSAPPLPEPTQVPASDGGGGFPPILAILGLLVVGLFGVVISFLRGG